MSNIDTNTNTVTPYVSGTTKPLSGQRLASFNWKIGTNEKDTKWFGIKRASKAVSVPVIADEAIVGNIELLVPHIRSFIEGVQDKIIRDLLDKNPDTLHVANVDIDMSACLEYLENSDSSGRLTKESVAAWFDTAIADSLMLALAAKMGPSSDTFTGAKQIKALTNEFKNKISALAGGKTFYPVKLAESLKKVIDLAPEGDVLGARFSVRLEKMIAASTELSVSLYDAL